MPVESEASADTTLYRVPGLPPPYLAMRVKGESPDGAATDRSIYFLGRREAATTAETTQITLLSKMVDRAVRQTGVPIDAIAIRRYPGQVDIPLQLEERYVSGATQLGIGQDVLMRGDFASPVEDWAARHELAHEKYQDNKYASILDNILKADDYLNNHLYKALQTEDPNVLRNIEIRFGSAKNFGLWLRQSEDRLNLAQQGVIGLARRLPEGDALSLADHLMLNHELHGQITSVLDRLPDTELIKNRIETADLFMTPPDDTPVPSETRAAIMRAGSYECRPGNDGNSFVKEFKLRLETAHEFRADEFAIRTSDNLEAELREVKNLIAGMDYDPQDEHPHPTEARIPRIERVARGLREGSITSLSPSHQIMPRLPAATDGRPSLKLGLSKA